SGEGSDELLGGYVGYRFDAQPKLPRGAKDVHELLEEEMNRKLWGAPDFFYEKNYHDFRDTTRALYSEAVNGAYESFDCLPRLGIDAGKLAALDPFHKRSYLDLKLRLSDHLVADHGDRTLYANSVEGRYPFLDVNLVECVKKIPPGVKLKGLVEKYILKKVAEKYLPAEVVYRQKFGFIAPGSPQLLRTHSEWINDLLSYERVRKQGYFNPATVERLKKAYGKEGFELNLPFENDLLISILTFNIFLDVFNMPGL
ncbi:MAG: asparagine synthetase B, partial [Cytophagales bacterium]|nr:asparagine synthetase B [Cytophagales bacterium]